MSRPAPVVMKFGGTSVADAAAMTRVVDIVRSQWKSQDDTRPPVVVVSALSKVTDGLIRTAEFARSGDGEKACQKEAVYGFQRERSLSTTPMSITATFIGLRTPSRRATAAGRRLPESFDFASASLRQASRRHGACSGRCGA